MEISNRQEQQILEIYKVKLVQHQTLYEHSPDVSMLEPQQVSLVVETVIEFLKKNPDFKY